MSKFENFKFESTEAVVAYLKQRADDISTVSLSIAEGVLMRGPQGEEAFFNRAAGIVMHIGGDSFVISTDAMEWLLNDGLLNRLGVPIRLLPLHATDESSNPEAGQ